MTCKNCGYENRLGVRYCQRCGQYIEPKRTLAQEVNCTPFVRQYGILFRKWGVFVCQRDNESTTELKR